MTTRETKRPTFREEDLWTTLMLDTDRPIVVVDNSGLVTAANQRAAEHVGASRPDDLIGRRMQDLCEPEYAAERLSAIREVATRGRPIALEGMTRGLWRRTVMRPLGGPETSGRVILVHVPVPPREGESPSTEPYEVRRARVDDFGPLARLSERELDVLRLIAKGLTTAEIAKAIHRSVKTVEWHRVSLGSKLGATNRVELARIAIRAGLVDLEPSPEPTVAS
ncbi:MAG: PAS domain-containing protein [Phycisphaeraceae bacterium]|nr:PAS domain-containing protein [Phycisphaeraceae bacterium]